MSNIKSTAKCYYCKEEFSKTSCLKHLGECEKRKDYLKLNSKKQDYFVIKVEGDKKYYLYLDVPTNILLKDLDVRQIMNVEKI